ncbi:MAG: uracil phosphoribosyltransferase [Spirochaetes bacterium]|jgi:uracil phosphoribosyltransferase|nr:uracil phosphoribosyltransferase [Spirochaetota bacterium]NLJ06008.1 uracil phosphoribosyltransferase [Exilispira sp.]MBP8991625.1 uracil phosphoribosyltransferase [Spirochaetota bacterium]HOV46197.1 uracil phosphoribosyltransferase [Exilispira sp.]HPO60160.1 uracil phosphoribosyltransferase [Exilispira sp.]
MDFTNLHIVDNPLVKHYLFHLRDKTTKPALFRTLTKKLTLLLCYEAAKEIELKEKTVETPLAKTKGEIIDNDIVLIPILRAGLGMIDAILELFPNVDVGYMGFQRDENTAIAKGYYSKLPNLKGKLVFIADPMLATGGSLSKAVEQIKTQNPRKIIIICIVSAPEGVTNILSKYPDIQIYTASLDSHLNEKKYIVPGLGDFGDRLYGTER